MIGLRKKVTTILGGLILVLMGHDLWAFEDPLDVPAAKHSNLPGASLIALDRAGQKLVVVGQRGLIVSSDNNGKTWQQSTVPLSSDLNDVHFSTPSSGYSVGHDGAILASSDAGLTWSKKFDGRQLQNVMKAFTSRVDVLSGVSSEDKENYKKLAERFAQEGAENPLLSVWSDSPDSAYVVGTFGLIMETVDGGQTWQALIDRTGNNEQLHFSAVRRIAGQLYIVGERGLVLRYNPESQHFVNVSVGYQGTLFGVTGNAEELIVYGLRGKIFRSRDEGDHWTEAQSGTKATLTAGATASNGVYVLASQSGELFVSKGAGQDFQKVKRDGNFSVSALLVTHALDIAMVGAKGFQIKKVD
jgi:photosystem II stability/assembly factor-like uncharacterized protein